MVDRQTRVVAACGLAFTVLMALSVAVVPSPPEYDAGATAIRAYLTIHADALGISTALTGAAALVLMAFFGFVHGRLRGAERDGGPISATFMVAAAAVTSSMLIAVVLEAALAQRIAPRADPSTLQALYAVWLIVFHTAVSMATVVALLSVAAGIVRWQIFPAWLAAAALLAATLTLIDNASDLATAGTGLGPLGVIAFAVVNVWIVGTSISALRGKTSNDPIAAPRPAKATNQARRPT
jgi:hypothetical protein